MVFTSFFYLFYSLPHHTRRSKWTWTCFRWMSCAAQRGMRRRRQMLLWWRSARCLLTASIIQTYNMRSLVCLGNLLSRSPSHNHHHHCLPLPFRAAALMSIWIDGGASRRSHRMRACDWCNERVAVNKQRRALALMKACCNLFCRRAERERSPRSRWQTFSLVKLGIRKVRRIDRTPLGPNRGRTLRRDGGAREGEIVDLAPLGCWEIAEAIFFSRASS